jgi:hypothetical protein
MVTTRLQIGESLIWGRTRSVKAGRARKDLRSIGPSEVLEIRQVHRSIAPDDHVELLRVGPGPFLLPI